MPPLITLEERRRLIEEELSDSSSEDEGSSESDYLNIRELYQVYEKV